ncbi:MAG: glycosyltransferase family 39 protein, partial [Deltaproteobacteria bacterium]
MLDANSGSDIVRTSHITNIMLHLLASCLVFMLLIKLGAGRTSATLFSILFVVHPMSAPAVAWIPGRNDVLLAVFLIPAFMFFIDYLKTGRKRYLILNLLFFSAGLLTKETALVLLPPELLYSCLITD